MHTLRGLGRTFYVGECAYLLSQVLALVKAANERVISTIYIINAPFEEISVVCPSSLDGSRIPG